MHFEEIEFENWGPYRGLHEVNLESTESSPVVLIYGENGKGKTSFAKALEWCLFGQLVGGGFDHSTYSNWSCTQDGLPFTVAVKLLFTVAERSEIDPNLHLAPRLFELSRSFTATPLDGGQGLKVRATNEQVQLRIDRMNPEPTAVIDSLIRLFLPFDMAKFFLFDGEQFGKLKEELERGASSQVKHNIQSVMGLPAINFLQDFLDAEYKRETKKVKQQQKNLQLNQELDRLEAQIKRQRQELSVARTQQREAAELETKLLGELQQVSGAEQIAKSLAKLRADLQTKKAELSVASQSVQRQLKESWWVPLSERIRASQVLESDASVKAIVLQAETFKIELIQESLHAKHCTICQQEIADLSALEAHLQQLTGSNGDVEVEKDYSISFTKAFPEPELVRNDLQHYLTDIARTSDDIRKIDGEMKEEASRLEGTDESTVTGKAAEMRSAVTRQSELTTLIDKIHEQISDTDKEITGLRKRVVSEAGFGWETELRFKILNQINEVLAEVETKFVNLVRQEVSERASEHYVEMMNNPDLIGLSIDENFQIHARHRTLGNKPVSSYGQSLVYVYAFIGALIDVSGNDGSWLIDTVGARLDSERMASVWKWLSSRKRQVIAMPHSGELKPSDAKIYLNTSIARQYQIVSAHGENDANSEIIEIGMQ